jgi:hypothetical protein
MNRCRVCNKRISKGAVTCVQHRPGRNEPARTIVLTDKALRYLDGLPEPTTPVVAVPLWMIGEKVSRD